MKLFIAPHNDDETLFGAYTLIREKPLVVIVTDSWIQFLRDTGVTADQRWNETVEAMKILGCPVIRLGIRDDVIDEWAVKDKLSRFVGFETIYSPAIQEGSPHHDLVSKVAQELFGDKVKLYSTYAKGQFCTPGTIEIKPTPEEIELKNKALDCYVSQVNLPSTAQHFISVRNLSEWFI
jgi:LmbE family N-acetylglucosaminyl deacetylase